jgi:hypothetical protein
MASENRNRYLQLLLTNDRLFYMGRLTAAQHTFNIGLASEAFVNSMGGRS